MSTNYQQRLHALISVVCPIHGVSIGNPNDKATWTFDPTPQATSEQITAAQAVIDSFDDSDAAQQAWQEAQKPERKDLRDNAIAAVQAINDYLALANPTNAQNLAQLRRLSQAVKRLIMWAVKQE